MQIQEFYPLETNPTGAVGLPSHLAGSFERDFSERAQTLADDLEMVIVAYERPKPKTTFNLDIPTSLEPSRYVQTAAQTGRELENRLSSIIGVSGLKRILVGNSAAATDAVLVAYSEQVKLDYLVVGDIVGTKQMSIGDFRDNWKRHQSIENGLKANNEEAGSSTASKVSSIFRLAVPVLRDLGQYGEAWSSTIAEDALRSIAESEDFYNLAVFAAFVEHSFANTPEDARLITDRLNGHRPDTAQPFKAKFMRDTYHSYFNDPGVFADFISTSLGEIGLTLDKAS